jgi:alpha-beta hydrolase superfamily lysophospholipase
VSGGWTRPPAPGGGLRRRRAFGRDDRALRLDLITLDTEDGHAWDALLYRPRAGAPGRRRLAVLVVHGSVGSYLAGVPRFVSFGLAQAGFTVLSINTRMANFGAFFGGGLLDRTPLDLDAAMGALRRRGERRIVLLGYSMGATMVTHYQALRSPPEVVGLLTLAHPRSLPLSLRRRWARFGARPDYAEMERRARRALDEDRDEIVVVRRATGPTDEPADAEIWTYRTWWASRGPEAPHAVSEERIGGVRVPIAMVQAGNDELVAAGEGDLLAEIALAGGCPKVRVDTIAGADHVFTGREAEVVEACLEALERWV